MVPVLIIIGLWLVWRLYCWRINYAKRLVGALVAENEVLRGQNPPAPMSVPQQPQSLVGTGLAMVSKLLAAGVPQSDIEGFCALAARMQRGEMSAIDLTHATYHQYRRVYDVIEATPDAQVMRS